MINIAKPFSNSMLIIEELGGKAWWETVLSDFFRPFEDFFPLSALKFVDAGFQFVVENMT